jgi:addiction module RelE/StbE family toxin
VKVVWMPGAKQDRLEIFTYIASDNPSAAVAMDERFDKAAANLASFSHAGHAGKIPGTRELFPHESYRLVYELGGDRLLILTVVHTSRQWPPEQDIRERRK